MSAPRPAEGGDIEEARRLAALRIVRCLAENPSPYTLSGTNTWVLGGDPAYVVDPGPADERHVQRLVALLESLGGLGGIALTHDHDDHAGALGQLRARMPAPVAAAVLQPDGGEGQVQLRDGTEFGPLRAIATPGHAPDHFAFVFGEACLTGDAVLGEGSVFLTPSPGALAGYLDALRRLAKLPLRVLCPGHGPPVWEPSVRLREYVEHRLEREQRLIAALGEGRRSTEDLLDGAWSEVPVPLRPLAAVTLAAHLDKLGEEGLLPDGVERPKGLEQLAGAERPSRLR